MDGQRLLFVKLMILYVGRSSAEHCDRATTARVQVGNLGQSGDFNWLGVLHVHIHEKNKIRVAMTGIVLVKLGYVLANADDIARIPPSIFKSDSKAMFLAARNTPWFAKPKSYVTHPEYEYSTLNTIAIVELNLDDVEDFPLNPICIPTGEIFNTSRYLYLTGFTDENKKMEKVFYNIKYLDKKVCDEFYNRAGLSSQKRIPTAYLCGYALSKVTQCVWDNGMALVSNVTGYFHLIGIGIQGPGCAAPARFIELFPYFSWIKSVISPQEFYDDIGYRRKDDVASVAVDHVNKGGDEFVPKHEIFTLNSSRRGAYPVFEPYRSEMEPLEHFIPNESSKSVLIIPFNDTWEQYEQAWDDSSKVLMYKDYFELKTPQRKGNSSFKVLHYSVSISVSSIIK